LSAGMHLDMPTCLILRRDPFTLKLFDRIK
jgi:hypothetical protein